MKKINRSCCFYKQWRKLLLMMKFVWIFIMIGFVATSAESYSQTERFDLKMENSSLKSILNEIEEQTEFYFFYNEAEIKELSNISVEINQKTIDEVLNNILKDNGLNYEVHDRYILIKKGNENSNASSIQQQKSVSGTVKDSSGQPLPGVSIIIKGTTTGVVSDFNGNYNLANVPSDATLVFSFVGMKSQEITVAGKTNFNIAMEEDAIGIEEVVAIGYGTQKKVNLTGSVASINEDELGRREVTNASTMLQGKVPGLSIVQNSGEPGNEGVNLKIRGLGSFGASSNPFVLIDGVPGSMSDLLPGDIESVSVLKDAASSAIYGNRAANGVILVTTKKGKAGTLNISYNGSYSIHSPSRTLDLITNSAEYMELWNEAKYNWSDNPSGLYTQEQIDAYKNATDRKQYPNTDWQDHIFRSAPVQSHNLSFSGGVHGTKYYVSLGYLDQEGIMIGFDYKKYNMRFNLESQVTEKVKFGANIGLKKGDRRAPRQGATDTYLAGISQAPTYGPILPDGSGRYTKKAYSHESNNKNAVAIVDSETLRNSEDYVVNVQGWIDINVAKGLSWYTKAAVIGDFLRERVFRPEIPLYNWHTGEQMGFLDVGGRGANDKSTQNIYSNLYSYLKYERAINDHNFSAQLGYSQDQNTFRSLEGYRKEFPKNNLQELNSGGESVQNAWGSGSEWALMSVFGRIGYQYKSRYLLEANIRNDGTSRIHNDTRWGMFTSYSAAWRISEESFMDFAGDWLDNLKLRGSFGELGNQDIGTYPYQDLIALTGAYSFDNSNLSTGAAQTKLSNRNLKWEKTTIADIGLDFTVFDGLTITADWYKKKTNDILRGSQVTGLVGLKPPTINDGVMENTGIELTVSYQNKVESGVFEGLKYGSWFNFTKINNKLVDFGAEEIGGRDIKREGLPWRTYYLYDWIGIFQSEDEVASSPKQFGDNTKPGDLKYRDVSGPDGTPDGIISSYDRIPVSGIYPDFEYSFSFNADWKNFDISFFFQGVENRKIYVNTHGKFPFFHGSSPTTAWRDRWTPTNPSTEVPRIGVQWGAYYTRQASTWNLEDASYLRLKNLQIGYTIPDRILNKLGAKSTRLYFSGDNLLTFTGYSGLDPERSGSGRAVNYPQNKVVSFGINVKF